MVIRFMGGVAFVFALVVAVSASDAMAGEIPMGFEIAGVNPAQADGSCAPGSTPGQLNFSNTSSFSVGGGGGVTLPVKLGPSASFSGSGSRDNSATLTMPVCVTTKPLDAAKK